MNFYLILEIIVLVEASAPGQVGHNGEHSKYQIKPIALLEVNEYLHEENEEKYIKHEDLKGIENEALAQLVGRTYLKIINKKYKCNTTEKLVRCYNGGLRGYLKKSTRDYWQRFKEHAKKRGIEIK